MEWLTLLVWALLFAVAIPAGLWSYRVATTGDTSISFAWLLPPRPEPRLAVMEHARVDRQRTLAGEIGTLEERAVALAADAEVLDLHQNDDDVVVVELEEIHVAVAHAGHRHGGPSGVGDTRHQRIARLRALLQVQPVKGNSNCCVP